MTVSDFTAMTGNSSAMNKYHHSAEGTKSLDELKEECSEVFMSDGSLTPDEIFASVEQVSLSDEDMEDLHDWLEDEEIRAEIEEEPEMTSLSGRQTAEPVPEPFTHRSSNAVLAADGIRAYLEKIGRYPLLSQEEETEIARRISEGDEEAYMLLFCHNLRLVVSNARNYTNRGLPLLDLPSASVSQLTRHGGSARQSPVPSRTLLIPSGSRFTCMKRSPSLRRPSVFLSRNSGVIPQTKKSWTEWERT